MTVNLTKKEVDIILDCLYRNKICELGCYYKVPKNVDCDRCKLTRDINKLIIKLGDKE